MDSPKSKLGFPGSEEAQRAGLLFSSIGSAFGSFPYQRRISTNGYAGNCLKDCRIRS